MKRHKLSDPYPTNPTVLTIGTFDGVHLGHQKIISRIIEVAKSKGLESTILTFFPHPRMVLQPDVEIKLLNTIDERREILKGFGVETLIIKNFTKEFADYTAEDYVKQVLLDQLHAQYMVIGYDHHFGRRRSAGIEELKQLSEIFDFEVEEISAKDIDDVSISSTKIRRALDEGDVETANSYLGYSFYITGSVVKGKGLGHTINFPTANIQIKENYKLIPKNGVYVVSASTEFGEFFGMMNIGTNPTVGGKKQSLEVNLFNFDENIYETSIKVKFLSRLRDEVKFETLDHLKLQLNSDKKSAQEYIDSIDG
ncbi:riboflavin kinase / FMN adenylyltransferase [Flavobacteriaceae bacterium MAR_2010_188]|nr:riboflavin kinase / FMN adenylyltransferase [Flavobacteriaceae bacterium MAR_2010_188]